MEAKGSKPKRHNRLFWKNDNELQVSLFKRRRKHSGNVTAKDVAKDAKLTRQTFYSHNENIEKAIKRTEASLIQDFKRFLDDRPCTGTPARVNSLLFTYCFAFMAQRGELFYEICSAMSLQQVLYRMMEVLYPKLQVTWLPEGSAAPAIDSELMDIYFRSMIGVIAWWGKTTKCNANETEPYVRQLLAITRDVTGKNRV